MSTPTDIAYKTFLMDCELRELSPKTLEFYRNTTGSFVDYLHDVGCFDMSEIQATHIRLFLNRMDDVSVGTKHAYARGIRVWLNFCVRENWVPESPMRSVRMPKRKKKILPAFSKEEIDRILRACNCERDKSLCMFLLDTGCRLKECANLDVEDLDIKRGSVFIDEGKGGKDRIVYFGLNTRKQLMRYFAELGSIPSDGPLWISQTSGKRLTYHGIKMVFKRLRAELKDIPHLHPHTFRRTFAIESLRNGMDIFMLQRLMGHSDLAVVQRYLDIVQDDLEEASQKFGVMDNH